MALLNPKQLQEALGPTAVPFQGMKQKDLKGELGQLLEKNNLSPDEILENLSSLMRSADAASTRLRAAETGLKLHGLLDSDGPKNDFNVVINIIDNEFSSTNPILIPRS